MKVADMPRLSDEVRADLEGRDLDLISFIVPVYNVEQYLDQCVESILQQTYTHIEVLLINDGSTDSSGKICDAYAEKDPRVKVFHKSNSGVSDARNLGIENAKGAYISFVDGDDFISEYFVEKLYRELVRHEVKIAVTDYNKLNTDSATFYFHTTDSYVKRMTATDYFDEIFETSTLAFVVPWCKLIATELFHGTHPIRFPSGMVVGEDKMVTYLLAWKAQDIIYLHEPNYTYRLRSGSATSSAFSPKRSADDLIGCEERMLDLALMGYPLEPAIAWYNYILEIHEMRLQHAELTDTDVYRKIQKKLAILRKEYH